MSSIDLTQKLPLHEDSRNVRLLHLTRLISKASSNAYGSPLSRRDPKPEQTLESWLSGQTESTRRITIDHDSQLAIGVSDVELHHEFQATATILYRTRKRLPTHPNYQRWTADPQVKTKLDTDSRELFEYLKALKREITNRTQGSDSKQQLEAEKAWDGLRRDLRFEDELAKENIQTAPESGNVEGSSGYQALTSSIFTPEPGAIPDEPPSPLSYWIDLHHIEDTKADPLGYENGLVPEEPPAPLSHWIDLCALEDYECLVPEVAPEPASMFLELYPLDHLSAAETVAKEEIQHHPKDDNLEDISSASSSTNQGLSNSTSKGVLGTIPAEPPSPLSYWIDLHPIEGAKSDHLGHENRLIPEEPPVPLSYWIDLRPIEYYGPLIPETAAEPTSVFLELHPLEDSSVPSIPPSPAEVTLESYELHD